MDTATRVQILDETDCILHNTNTLGKVMNPIILTLVGTSFQNSFKIRSREYLTSYTSQILYYHFSIPLLMKNSLIAPLTF